jgi:pyruvate dehydrogenase E1 component
MPPVPRDLTFIDGFVHQLPDSDPVETQEWLESLDSVVREQGGKRGQFLLAKLTERAHQMSLGIPGSVSTPYVNTIPASDQPAYPGDAAMEKRIRRFIRWNAAVMVIKANHRTKGIGGHLSTFASSALLYEVGFNHFFRGKDHDGTGDAIYIQGHAAPGIYARAYLEGRLDEQHLDNFRNEIAIPA